MRSAIGAIVMGMLAACEPARPLDSGVTPTGDATPSSDSSGDSSALPCNLAGTWRGNVPGGPFAGQSITWTFTAGGTWNSVLGAATVQGTWVVIGASVMLTDTASTPASIACAASDQGSYTATFSNACTTVQLIATTEPCEGRRVVADTLSMTRQ